jgi:hypothetical protein
MPFSVPNFNLTCDIFSAPWPVGAPRIAGVPCNLQFGRRLQSGIGALGFNDSGPILMSLLLPALTDIRALQCQALGDIVECPSGSGRVYLVLGVDDVGKGFPNEFRVAMMTAASEFSVGSSFTGLLWPTPIP